jgi:polyisoprenoid-binding protein YceI
MNKTRWGRAGLVRGALIGEIGRTTEARQLIAAMHMKPLFLSMLLGLMISLPLLAQTATVVAPESSVSVAGTSNRNDWTVYAPQLEGTLRLQGSGAAMAVSSADIRIHTPAIESRNSVIMDRLMHSALKTAEHPYIVFSLNQAVSVRGAAPVAAKGKLTVAGVTRDIDMTVRAERLADGRIKVSGSYPMKMTDYEITPPTAMFGQLRTADAVTVHFEVIAR